jgi:hypothetical protein
MQRIAVPMIGGMVSTLLTLIVIPGVYAALKGRDSIAASWRIPAADVSCGSAAPGAPSAIRG